MDSKIILDVRDLKKIYGHGNAKTEALRGVSFKIKKGEFVALSGPSGSGKSTAFHQISLLDNPTSGKVFISGVDVSSLNESDRSNFRLKKVGYVFQHYELLNELTALENICLPMMVQKGYTHEVKEKAEKVLKSIGLIERKNHYPNELSGGEKQRVSIARALIKEPDIILADEPTANLDSLAGENIMKLLKNLNKKKRITIFVINHEKEFEKYFDRVIRLKDGLIVKS